MLRIKDESLIKLSLDEIINACKQNDLKAQSQLYQLYKDDLYVLCLKYCKNIEDAQDNLQDAFIEILKSIKKFNNSGSFEGWIKRITINKAIDKYKKNDFTNVIINDDILFDTTINTDEIDHVPLHKILGLVQSLPSKYRLVFSLYELDAYSHKEISELLSISEGTSKSNLHRAKLILKEKIYEMNKTQKTQKNYGN